MADLRLRLDVAEGEGPVWRRAKVLDAQTGEEYTNVFEWRETEVQGTAAVAVTFAQPREGNPLRVIAVSAGDEPLADLYEGPEV